MKILSIDSSTPIAGIAVNDDSILLGEYFVNTTNTHSEKLMPMIAQLLKELSLTIKDLDAIAVTQGPGSFTGLRIGMATAKALAQGANKQLITVPTLDCLAYQLIHYPGYICPIMNAQKQQVYTALYESDLSSKIPSRISEYQAISVKDLANQLKIMNTPVWFCGDGVAPFQSVLEEILGEQAHFASGHLCLPRAGALAMLANQKAENQQFSDLYTTDLIYIRKSEAEVQWEAKQKQMQ